MDRLVTNSSALQCFRMMKPQFSSVIGNAFRNGTVNNSPLLGGRQSHTVHARRLVTGSFNKYGLRYSQIMQIRKELRAVQQILENSNLQVSCISPVLTDQQQRLYSSERGSHRNTDNDGQESSEEGGGQRQGDDKQAAMLVLFTSLVIAMMALNVAVENSIRTIQLNWNDFQKELLLKGEVKRIRIYRKNDTQEVVRVDLQPGGRLRGTLITPADMIVVDTPHRGWFENKLNEFEVDFGIAANDRIPVEYVRGNNVMSFLFTLLIISILASMVFGIRKGNKASFSNSMQEIMMSPFKMNVRRGDVAGASKIKFKDVAGLTEAKVELLEFVDYIKKPQRFKDLGAKVPKGALLLGPPGCGKTLLAKALASEAEVPFFAMAGSEFIEMIGGLGASRVRDLFKQARANTPCIVYIDEIDTIGQQRGGGGNSEMGLSRESEQTLNQLLTEMDGMGTKEGVVILASTNRSEVLDKALLRPGRFDRHILIDLPTLKERVELFELYLSKLKLSEPMSAYAPRLAQLTPGMSGADIANICNEAAIHAARGSRKVVSAKDFEYATERVIAGVAKTTSTMSPAEKKVVAYHECGHALAGWLLEHTDALLKISIVPRTSAMLGFAQYVPSEYKLYSTEQLFDRMCMALAGRAAESIIFNKITNGAQDDLNRVTKMAYAQIKTYGMNPVIGQLSFPTEEETGMRFGPKPYSKQLANLMDQEAQQLVARAYKHVEKLLIDNKDKLHKLATCLLEKETMNYSDVEMAIGPPPHGKKNTVNVMDYLAELEKADKR